MGGLGTSPLPGWDGSAAKNAAGQGRNVPDTPPRASPPHETQQQSLVPNTTHHPTLTPTPNPFQALTAQPTQNTQSTTNGRSNPETPPRSAPSPPQHDTLNSVSGWSPRCLLCWRWFGGCGSVVVVVLGLFERRCWYGLDRW